MHFFLYILLVILVCSRLPADFFGRVFRIMLFGVLIVGLISIFISYPWSFWVFVVTIFCILLTIHKNGEIAATKERENKLEKEKRKAIRQKIEEEKEKAIRQKIEEERAIKQENEAPLLAIRLKWDEDIKVDAERLSLKEWELTRFRRQAIAKANEAMRQQNREALKSDKLEYVGFDKLIRIEHIAQIFYKELIEEYQINSIYFVQSSNDQKLLKEMNKALSNCDGYKNGMSIIAENNKFRLGINSKTIETNEANEILSQAYKLVFGKYIK
jgi:hypothetical protein